MSFIHMRIARPVSDLEASYGMYARGLGLQKIASFIDHDGFSGVMLGLDNLPWHIEFTCCHQHPVKPAATEEDLLVLYYPDAAEWQLTCAKMVDAGFMAVNAFNPYWDKKGQTFADADGYRTVIQNSCWPVA
ncbi:VOC family protein [Pluralibacter gergoviae]|uniref:VOC family protein n=1 Tax=Pluralibacter gergoviae TaxID=61647 RepID=UPI002ED87E10